MKLWRIAAVVLILVIFGGILLNGTFVPLSTALPSTTDSVSIKNNLIHVTRATTAAEHERRLGGRTGLASDEGMLFVFETDGDYAFWMKDMLFSIDIVWIDSSGNIVYIAPSVAPDTYPAAFDPHQSARYVLELPAGYAAAHGVKAGDTVAL